MKILVVSNMFPNKENPSYGVFVKNFCNQLDSMNISYDKVVMMKKKGKIKKILGYFFFYLISFIKCLFNEYDIVYIHYASHSSIGVLLAAKLKKINIFTNLHGSDVIPENKKQYKMQIYTKKILNISKKVIVPSEYFKTVVSKKYNVSPEMVYIYPSGGINKNIFHKSDDFMVSKVRKEYHINLDLFTFGMAGRISEKKGWDTFIDAIKILVENDYYANFIIVGDGPESERLQKKLKELHLQDKIYFKRNLISQSDLSTYYSILDWFIFPTRREGESLGLVAFEAMACETPVIASDYASPKYYIKDGFNGFKFEVNNPYKLAECMMYIINHQLSKDKFKDALEQTVEPFKVENIRDCLEKILVGDNTYEINL